MWKAEVPEDTPKVEKEPASQEVQEGNTSRTVRLILQQNESLSQIKSAMSASTVIESMS
jgi:hypothetical protein